LENCPVVDALLEIDTRRWRQRPLASETRREVPQVIRRLRQARYQVAIDFQGLFKSALLARTSGADERIGFDPPHPPAPGARFFYTQTVAPSPKSPHIIAQNNALLQPLGIMVDHWDFPIAIAPEDQRYVEDQLRPWSGDPFLIINPGGGWVNKLWPADRYGALIRQVYEKWGL